VNPTERKATNSSCAIGLWLLWSYINVLARKIEGGREGGREGGGGEEGGERELWIQKFSKINNVKCHSDIVHISMAIIAYRCTRINKPIIAVQNKLVLVSARFQVNLL